MYNNGINERNGCDGRLQRYIVSKSEDWQEIAHGDRRE